MVKSRLGRGFDALIPKDLDSSLLEEDKHRVQKLPISDISPNPSQPRHTFEDSALAELSASIQVHGVLQPIIVVRQGQGYKIVAGERRWRAARAAGLTHLPAIVRSLKELEQVELALIENIQRVDLSPLEQALSVYHLQQQLNLSLEEIAQKLGKAPSTLSNLTRLLQLPLTAREALSQGQISEGHARAILALKAKPKLQEELLGCILNNSWTVRQAEQFARAAKKNLPTKLSLSRVNDETNLTKRLSGLFKMPVKIRRSAKGGELTIAFKSEEELQWLADKLENYSK